jgi:hypothetical protein
MTAKQTAEAKRALRMLTFAKARVEDFTHSPLTKVDVKHAQTITKLEQVIADLGGKEAIQEANEFGGETEQQRGDRGTVEAMLRAINTTMAAIAEERKQPALMDRFRMPHGDGDTELAAKLRSFATALAEGNLFPVLEEHSLVVTKEGLEKMATDLLEGTGEQGAARAKRVGATASIPDSLRTARSCKKTFDAIYGNFYTGNTAMLAEWKSASHVPRSGGGDKPDGKGGGGDTPPTPPK